MQTDKTTTIQEVKDKINAFVTARDWQQFHTAKNLSMAIAAEAAELMEHFLWVDSEQSSEKMLQKKEEIQQEVVDVIYMAMCLINRYDIDFVTALEKKMAINAQRYPVEKAKGNAKKYTELV